MKRIVLSLSVLLMLVQNGFAETDAEYDKISTMNQVSFGNKHIDATKQPIIIVQLLVLVFA